MPDLLLWAPHGPLTSTRDVLPSQPRVVRDAHLARDKQTRWKMSAVARIVRSNSFTLHAQREVRSPHLLFKKLSQN